MLDGRRQSFNRTAYVYTTAMTTLIREPPNYYGDRDTTCLPVAHSSMLFPAGTAPDLGPQPVSGPKPYYSRG